MITETEIKKLYPSFEVDIIKDLFEDDLRNPITKKDNKELIRLLSEIQGILCRFKHKHNESEYYIKELNGHINILIGELDKEVKC